MKNIILVKKFGPRNQQARYFAKKQQVPALKNDDLQSSLMDEQFNAQMEESMEHFMKGSGMNEINEKFPQMKMFSESLERIQSLGGLPSISEDMMGEKKKKPSIPKLIINRNEGISPSKLVAYFDNPDMEEIDKAHQLKETINLIDSWRKPLTSLELASLRFCLVFQAKSNNILENPSLALAALSRAEDIIDYTIEFEQSQPMSLLTLEKGIAYMKLKSYSLAIRTLTSLIDFVDCGSDVYLVALAHRSKCYYNCENPEKAMIDINELLCYKEDDAFARFDRSLYTFQTNPKVAQRDLEYILDSPKMSKYKDECYFRLGVLFSTQKKFHDALQMYEKLEAINPRHHALEHGRRFAMDGLRESGEEKATPENEEKYRQMEKDLKLKSKKISNLAKEIDQGSGKVMAKQTKQRMLEEALEAKINKKEQEVLMSLKKKGVSSNE